MTDKFQAIVLRHAFLIVQHERRLNGVQMAVALGITKDTYWKIARGTRSIRKVLFLGYIAMLEEIRGA